LSKCASNPRRFDESRVNPPYLRRNRASAAKTRNTARPRLSAYRQTKFHRSEPRPVFRFARDASACALVMRGAEVCRAKEGKYSRDKEIHSEGDSLRAPFRG